jgi:chitodextrinase
MRRGLRVPKFVFWLSCLAAVTGTHAASLDWRVSSPNNYDYGQQLTLPSEFGSGEFTLELWIRPNNSFPIGSTAGGNGQLQNWSNSDLAPYSSSDWWFAGNFLLDGHNNASFANGTFSLQFYGGGRVRWLFGDGASNSAAGSVWSVGAFPASSAPSLLDGQWHHLALVRRFVGSTQSRLELWIDGSLIDTETSSARTNMRQWWNNWSGFPSAQRGWFWGVEKQAAIGALSQYEDYKGLVDELRFWSRAKTSSELQSNFANPVSGTEPGLVGRFAFSEGSGNQACDSLSASTCISLVNASSAWSAADAPLSGGSPDTTAPTTPSNLQGNAVSSTRIDLTWSASTDDTGVVSYRVLRNGSAVANPIGSSFSDTGLTPNTTYSYTVSAVDAAGNRSSESLAIQVSTPAAADTTAPTVPGNLQGGAVSSTRVDLTWSASTDDTGVVSYRVLRNGSVVGIPTNRVFNDSGLAANTSYTYTVSAIDAAGNRSAESSALQLATPAEPPATDVQPPSTPTSLRNTSITATEIAIDWQAASDNVGVVSYRIVRNGTPIGSTATLAFRDTGLTPSTNYNYSVSAADAAGNRSAESAVISLTTLVQPPPPTDTQPPSVPPNLRAAVFSATRIDLSWGAATDNVAVTAYRLMRDGAVIANTASTSFSDAALAPNTSYIYTVSATDAAVNRSAESAAVQASTPASPPAAPDTQAPTAPANLTATGASPTEIDLTWTAATDNVGVTGYRILRDGVAIASTTVTTFRDSGLTSNRTYSYSVYALDAAGNRSPDSAARQANTLVQVEVTRGKGSADRLSLATLLAILAGAWRRRSGPYGRSRNSRAGTPPTIV